MIQILVKIRRIWTLNGMLYFFNSILQNTNQLMDFRGPKKRRNRIVQENHPIGNLYRTTMQTR